jgi:4-hydroxybenzoate polyprenyltransferase
MKWGLGQSYDRVEYLNEKTRAYIDLTQPASSVGASVAFARASIFFFSYTQEPSAALDNYMSIVYASSTIFFAHAAAQVLNQSEDAEMDAQSDNKDTRPIPSGVVSEDEARSIAWILASFAFARSYLVSLQFGVFVTVVLFMGVFYNLRPIRAKERIISIPWQATSRGLLSFPLVWAAYGSVLDSVPWVLGVFMFFYCFGFQNTADISDRVVDAKFGIKTFVVEFGMKRVRQIMLGSTLMMMGVLTLSTSLGFIENEYIGMTVIVPYCLLMWSWLTMDRKSVSNITGNHPTYLMYYIGMVLCVVVPLTISLV